MTMSAFMVQDKTINQVVTWLASDTETGSYIRRFLAWKYDLDLANYGWEKTLANAMFQLNCDGVNARYGGGEAEKARPLNFQYKLERSSSDVQVFKSLRCWLYQCWEGDILKTKLYQFFEEVAGRLALKIVSDLPEYKNARWGW